MITFRAMQVALSPWGQSPAKDYIALSSSVSDLPVGLAFFAGANADRQFLIELNEEIEKLVCGEAAEVAVDGMGDFGLLNPYQRRNFAWGKWVVCNFFELL